MIKRFRYLGLGFPRENLSTKIIRGDGVVHGFMGNFEKAIPKSIHLQKFEEIFRIRGKSFSGVGKHH